MGLYEDCLKTMQGNPSLVPDTISDDISIITAQDRLSVFTTVPSVVPASRAELRAREVYYISDLHLDNHILSHFQEGASDSLIEEYIHSKVLQLLSGDLETDIRRFKSPVVLFGGDTSSSFGIARFFYRDFINTWDTILHEEYDQTAALFEPLNTKLAAVKGEIDEWKVKHPWAENPTKPLLEYSDQRVPRRIKQLIEQSDEIENQIHEKRQSKGLSYNWERDYQLALKRKFIYTVLGNHELWDFASYKDCDEAYSTLFKELHIPYLNGQIFWLGPHSIPLALERDPKTGEYIRTPLKRDDNPKSFDAQMYAFSNILITGGIGFSEHNTSFNASQGIYGASVDREHEIEMCRRWRATFFEALAAAKENHCSLVVLTHMPVSDWLEEFDRISNCVFLTGHTHRNVAVNGDNNVALYADNQVGYSGTRFHFKKAALYIPRNPFASDPDGYREISCDEYREFYRYVDEQIPGTGIIERHIQQYSGKLYVIKQETYYGFFLITSKGVYICNGGQIRTIGFPESLDRYNDDFMRMVNAYVRVLTPLRKAQEMISAAIRKIGGTGRIHGTIVDIDFFNHVMINTEDGKITFNNSPLFGVVKTYTNIVSLLREHCPELAEHYLRSGEELMVPIDDADSALAVNRYVRVDIKNSQYAISRRVNALQRLFDKHILRDWDYEAIRKTMESGMDYLGE